MTYLIYCIIIFTATFLGSFVGLGGGVIIKPALDLLGADTVDTVGFISAVAVFSMSISATVNHLHSKTKFDKKVVLFVSAGAAAGGYIGNMIFVRAVTALPNNTVKGIQGLVLGLFMIVVITYVNGSFKSFKVENPVGILSVGLFLGILSSFLGIGGGPINVAFLMFFFSFTMKESAVYSVAIIFFSQLAKLITIYAQNVFVPYDLKILIFIIPCAVIGGIMGARLNKKSDEKLIKKTFTFALCAVACMSFYNAASALSIK